LFLLCGEQSGNQGETDTVPTPVVIIDQDTDPNATVVEITFGDRLGALLDTVCHSLSKSMPLLSYVLLFLDDNIFYIVNVEFVEYVISRCVLLLL
jgi:hypothetical protein